MLSNIILRSTAAFGGTPFRLNKCTALTSASGGAVGGAVGGVPGALVGGALGVAGTPPAKEPPAAPVEAAVKAVHLNKRKGAPPKAAVLLKIILDNIG